jgi:hypothetical protein
METVCFFEMLVSTYESTLRHKPKEQLYRIISRMKNSSKKCEISSFTAASMKLRIFCDIQLRTRQYSSEDSERQLRNTPTFNDSFQLVTPV